MAVYGGSASSPCVLYTGAWGPVFNGIAIRLARPIDGSVVRDRSTACWLSLPSYLWPYALSGSFEPSPSPSASKLGVSPQTKGHHALGNGLPKPSENWNPHSALPEANWPPPSIDCAADELVWLKLHSSLDLHNKRRLQCDGFSVQCSSLQRLLPDRHPLPHLRSCDQQ